ncbi:Uncharacterised protein r2_g2340 [Pycnogonum litorale]
MIKKILLICMLSSAKASASFQVFTNVRSTLRLTNFTSDKISITGGACLEMGGNCPGYGCENTHDPASMSCYIMPIQWESGGFPTETCEDCQVFRRHRSCDNGRCKNAGTCTTVDYVLENNERYVCCPTNFCGPDCSTDNFRHVQDVTHKGPKINTGPYRITVEQCKAACMSSDDCKSFIFLDFHAQADECYLKKSDHFEYPLLPIIRDTFIIHYYYRTKICETY